ncbi:MAG: alpha/beta hydrolase [Gammaproteobacteria bacterium]|nr:alpha/beta hydrolase [Pseudomonadales bacterium]
MKPVYRSPAGRDLILTRYRDSLCAWPKPFEQLTIPTRQGKTAVIRCGDRDKPAMFLLHGSMSNSLIWMKDAASWKQHFQLFAIDIIGEPGCSAESRPDLHSEAYAQWLDDILDSLAVTSGSFVGISLGGWLALDYAIRRPARVKRMVVLCPAGIGRQKHSLVFKALLLSLLGAWGKRRLRALVTGNTSEQADADFLRYLNYQTLIQQYFRPRIVRFKLFSDADLRSITAPTLLIAGGQDAFFDFSDAEARLSRLHCNIEVRFQEQLGHMIINQGEEILRFLQQQPE